jgi:uncharacterized membrane protein (UPF0127 family)
VLLPICPSVNVLRRARNYDAELRRADGTVVCERVRVAATARARMRGLLGRAGLASGEGLLLSPAGSIHTFFMRFAIDAVFLDRELVVRAVRPTLAPWRVAAARGVRGVRTVLEVGAGEAELRRISVGERLELRPLT